MSPLVTIAVVCNIFLVVFLIATVVNLRGRLKEQSDHYSLMQPYTTKLQTSLSEKERELAALQKNLEETEERLDKIRAAGHLKEDDLRGLIVSARMSCQSLERKLANLLIVVESNYLQSVPTTKEFDDEQGTDDSQRQLPQ